MDEGNCTPMSLDAVGGVQTESTQNDNATVYGVSEKKTTPTGINSVRVHVMLRVNVNVNEADHGQDGVVDYRSLTGLPSVQYNSLDSSSSPDDTLRVKKPKKSPPQESKEQVLDQTSQSEMDPAETNTSMRGLDDSFLNQLANKYQQNDEDNGEEDDEDEGHINEMSETDMVNDGLHSDALQQEDGISDGIETQAHRHKRKRHHRKAKFYDVDDPFIDDAEQAYEFPSVRPVIDGFFVYKGPLEVMSLFPNEDDDESRNDNGGNEDGDNIDGTRRKQGKNKKRKFLSEEERLENARKRRISNEEEYASLKTELEKKKIQLKPLYEQLKVLIAALPATVTESIEEDGTLPTPAENPETPIHFKWTRELRHAVYELVEAESSVAHLDFRKRKMGRQRAQKVVDGRLRRALYQKLVRLWPEGWVNTVDLGRAWSAVRIAGIKKEKKREQILAEGGYEQAEKDRLEKKEQRKELKRQERKTARMAEKMAAKPEEPSEHKKLRKTPTEQSAANMGSQQRKRMKMPKDGERDAAISQKLAALGTDNKPLGKRMSSIIFLNEGSSQLEDVMFLADWNLFSRYDSIFSIPGDHVEKANRKESRMEMSARLDSEVTDLRIRRYAKVKINANTGVKLKDDQKDDLPGSSNPNIIVIDGSSSDME